MRKDDLLAIGRPVRLVIGNTRRERCVCQLHGMAAIGMHESEIHRGRVAVGTNRIIRHIIDNLAAIGRPFGFLRAVTHACAGGQLRLACAVSVHHPDIAGAIGKDVREEDFGAVR